MEQVVKQLAFTPSQKDFISRFFSDMLEIEFDNNRRAQIAARANAPTQHKNAVNKVPEEEKVSDFAYPGKRIVHHALIAIFQFSLLISNTRI